MNFTYWQKFRTAWISGGWILIAATVLQNYSEPASAQELKGIQKMDMQHTNWQPWCIGRFVVDLPPEAIFDGGNLNYDFYTTLKATPMEPAAFQTMLQKRHEELKAIKHRHASTYLIDAAGIKDVPHSGLLIFYSDDVNITMYTLEAYKFVNGMSFKVVTEATPDRVTIATQRITDLMKRVVARADHEIPNVAGFCFKNGFVPDTGIKLEHLDFGFTFKGHPDTYLNVTTYVRDIDNAEEPLLKKMAEGKAEFGSRVASVKTLRQGDRKVDDSPGQEILAKGPMEGGFVGHAFRWEAVGLPSDSLHPQISIELSTANRFEAIKGQPASLTDDEAISVWDHVLHSFKLRPSSAPVKAGEAQPQAIKLGTQVATGQVCPQSGVWISHDGNTKLFLRAGENVPTTKVRKKLSVVQKMRGDLDYEYVETVWTLSEYRDNGGKPIA